MAFLVVENGMKRSNLMNKDISLNDIFHFDDLLAKPENKGRRVKLRFNKDWGNKDNWFSFSNEFRRGSDLFEPYLLSMSNRRNRADDIQFNFIEIGGIDGFCWCLSYFRDQFTN